MATKKKTEKTKLFFCGTAGNDNPGCWAKMQTEAEARWMVDELLKHAGYSLTPFKQFRIEKHRGEFDSKHYLYGVAEPAFDGSIDNTHEGVMVELDGKVVYNDIQPTDQSLEDGDHDDECEICAKK